jgi:glycosyltransferase involved in cell wall biosynthesis
MGNESARVLVCNAGTLHVFALAKALHREGLLHACATSLFVNRRQLGLLPAFGPRAFRRDAIARRVANRMCPELEGRVRAYPLPELLHLGCSRLGLGSRDAWIRWRNRRFQAWVARRILDGVDVVWSFDTCSRWLFSVAKSRGLKCVLDVSIAHPAAGDEILSEHAARCPQYSSDLHGLGKSAAEIAERQLEMELADIVVSASSFTAGTLDRFQVPREKVRVVPYGVNLDGFHPAADAGVTREKTTFLFVGWFSQRKGIYYLLEAWARSGLGARHELLLAGGSRGQLRCWPGELPAGVRCLGRVPHGELASVYRGADVFVFPSLFEGFGLVLLEAMASGLPVLTTPHTAGPDLVADGTEGFLSAPGDVSELASQMRMLADDPVRCRAMGSAARRRAEYYTWERYGANCAKVVGDLVNLRSGPSGR